MPIKSGPTASIGVHSKVARRALADQVRLERLHHIHLVQHAFLWITGPRTSRFEPQKIEAFPDPSALKAYARQGPADLEERLADAGEALEGVKEIPWFQPTLKIKRRHALCKPRCRVTATGTKCNPVSGTRGAFRRRLTSFCGCKKDSRTPVGSKRWN